MELENNINLNQGVTLELLTKVIENMDYALIVARPDGKFLIWNDKADELFNREISRGADYKSDYKVCTLDGKTFDQNYTPMGIALNGGSVNKEKLFIVGGKNKNGVYVEVSSKPIYDEYGEVEAAMVMLMDITKQQIFWKDVEGVIKKAENFIKEKIGVDYEILKKKYYLTHS